MDTMTFAFVLILLAVGVLLIAEVGPFYSRKDYSRESPEDEGGREEHHAKLRELNRMRRQRDRVWFRMDKLHDEFVKRSAVDKQVMRQERTEASSQSSGVEADGWNDVTLAYIKEKYESFLKNK
ncbi:MAG TPA: hypothetical protein VF735_04265 [Pyrinomonadaceae bacterium]|jgi:hypothetical protein